MFPQLSIGNMTVSSFGVFLAAGFLFGIFLVWRLCRAWDLDEERSLDLILLTVIGALIGARVYFVIGHLQPFLASPLNLILVNKAPGLVLWGGILGGWLTIYFFAKRSRMDFWLVSDIAAVGVLGGLILSDVGCFFGGCNVGIPSIGKRWPIQLVEGLLLSISLVKIWSQATHFHQRGKIASLVLILVGVIKLILEPFKQDHSETVFAVICIFLGVIIYYKITKQNPITHLKSLGGFLVKFVTYPQVRTEVGKGAVQTLYKNWYNQKTAIGWKLRNLKKYLKV